MKSMGQDIYTEFWKKILIRIKDEFQQGDMQVEFDIPELADLGNRDEKNYDGNVFYRFGTLLNNTDKAPYRDLVLAIKSSGSIKPFLNKEFAIKVNSNKHLTATFKEVSIEDLIISYKKIIAAGNENEIYKWKILGKKYFDLDASDFYSMIKAIDFNNLVYHNGKVVLWELCSNYPEEMRQAFKKLFSENNPLKERILAFRNGVEQMYRRTEPKLGTHQDERSIATYLTYYNPEKYAFYKNSFYGKYCKLLGIKEAGTNENYIHYLGLLQDLISKFILTDNELLALENKFRPVNGFTDNSKLLLAQDILYQTLDGKWEAESVTDDLDLIESTETNKPNEMINNPPHNQILYGPPGTGKTYHTINKAVAIANPSFNIKIATRKELTTEYERLVKEGQVEFVTFHQSLSYEDFIEGIKPVEPKEEDAFLKYEIKEGIFKRLAERASKIPDTKPTGFSILEENFQKANFYKISLGNTSNPDDDHIYDWCIKNNYIALGWGDANDFTGLSEAAIQKMVPDHLEKYAAQAINYFIHYVKPGDYIVVTYGNFLFRAIGRVTGSYEYKNIPELYVHQFRKVEWLLKDAELPYEEVYNKQFSQSSIYWLNKREIKKDFFVKTKEEITKEDKSKNYVLIIDEINRGNVSQIFGELITLIETDKRAGKDEALSVVLPYSKKVFSVPSNLYIIGTMNTADRSVEALDTALRRRFEFDEMKPDATLLSPLEMYERFLGRRDLIDTEYADFEKDPNKIISQNFNDLFGLSKEKETEFIENQLALHNGENVEEIILEESDFTGLSLEKLLISINNRLEILLSKDHQLGHAFLMEVYSLADLQTAFKHKILPLLQEYFYNNYAKIGLVLGNAFVEQNVVNKGSFAKFKDEQDTINDYDGKIIYTLVDPFILKEDAFQSIYS